MKIVEVVKLPNGVDVVVEHQDRVFRFYKHRHPGGDVPFAWIKKRIEQTLYAEKLERDFATIRADPKALLAWAFKNRDRREISDLLDRLAEERQLSEEP